MEELSQADFEKVVEEARATNDEIQEVFHFEVGRENDFGRMREISRGLSLEDQEKLIKIFERRVEVLGKLSLPLAYHDLINDIHSYAYPRVMESPLAKDIVPKWRSFFADSFDFQNNDFKQDIKDSKCCFFGCDAFMGMWDKLESYGLSFEKNILFFNEISEAVCAGWNATLGITNQMRPQRIIGFTNSAQRMPEFDVQYDGDGGSSYYVFRDNAVSLDYRHLMDVAFHEPHHDLQHRLRIFGVQDISGPHREMLGRVKEIFSIHNFCPPEVFGEPKNQRLCDVSYLSYMFAPQEVGAFHQGLLAGLEFSRDMDVPMPCWMPMKFEQKPILKDVMPRALIEHFFPVRPEFSGVSQAKISRDPA